MQGEHLGENAELYALGQLDALESSRAQRHVRTCDECAKRLGDAEAAVLRLIESGGVTPAPSRLDPHVRRHAGPPYGWIAAVAAAFVIGLLPWGISALRHPDSASGANQQLAMNAMLAGHFLHAPAVALVDGAPVAKVIYPREGGWLYVLVGPANRPVQVVAITGTQRKTIASIEPAGQTRTAFVQITRRVSSVEFLEAGRAVASAHIAYASSPAP
jgi:anti-sigma factor RsiW